MQSVTSAFTAEERDSVRSIAHNLQVSWHKESTLGNRTFTIGVSTIGGDDAIGATPGAVVGPAAFNYFDESAYVTEMSWEHNLAQPIGGLNKSLASVSLDNTSGRYLPRYMGGNSELFTAILPSRPIILNSGFNLPPDETIPQFSGVLTRTPAIDMANRSVSLESSDYVHYFQNRYIDRTTMFTGVRTDVVVESLLSQLGMSTSQYVLDQGINVIPFAYYDNGTKFSDAINQLVQAENGQFYQDESGIFRFENRQHWDNAPYTQVQKIVLTGQVINSQVPNTDHIINVVELTSNPRVKTSSTTIYALSGTITLNTGVTTIFVDFENPVLAASAPVYSAFSNEDGTGTNLTASVSVAVSLFAKSAKYVFTNSSATTAYITSMTVQGRWAIERYADPLYTRVVDSSSVTAYQEHPITINNDYIQDTTWAESFGQMVLTDFSDPENIQEITIRAIPELQRGDLISWQGRYWRVYKIKNTLSPKSGYIQQITMVQRTLTTYFRIGISAIGDGDRIAA